MKRNYTTDTREYYRKLLRLAVPISLQHFMLAAVAAGDAVMLGRTSQDAMAAVSLATQIQFVQNIVVTSVTAAGVILGAQYWGKKDLRTVGDIFWIMLRICGAISVLFALGCLFAPEALMLVFTNDPALIRIGAGYLRIAGWSYLLTGFSQCYLTMMKITEHASASAWISSLAVVLNIVLNAVFIFGLFGAPAMGARGAATATLIARAVEFVLSVLVCFRKGYVRPDLARAFYFSRILRKDFLRHAFPLLGGALFWGVGFTSYTAIVGHLGADAAAANAVTAVVRDLMCCLCNGFSAGGGIIVGNELGAGDLAKGKDYGDRTMRIGFLIGFFCTAVILLLIPPVAHYMILTPQARKYLIGMMVIAAFYMIGRSCNTVIINGIFAAGGDTLFDVYSLAVTMWCFAIPLAAAGAFLFHWPVLLVYGCTCLDELGKIPWVMYHYKKYKWVKDLTRDLRN